MTSTSEPADPLQMALDEAQKLMDSLGATPSEDGIDGFAIDSDDEEDLVTEEINLKDSIDVHPLHDDFLNVSAATTPTASASTPTTTTSTTTPVPLPVSSAGAATTSPSAPESSASNTTSNTMGVSPASLDLFKAQTSRFASNFVNMAQRAAQVASAAAAGVPTTTTTTQPSLQQQQQQPLTSYSLGSTISSAMSMTSPSSQQTQQQQTQQQTPAPELDKEQKETLVKTHVGELLQGEQVIMFLTNLLHVSDSTGQVYTSTDSSSTSSSSMWCCAMTFYRILLFATHPPSSIAPPTDWNVSCWPALPTHTVLQMPLASIDRVEKSIFAGSTSVMGLQLVGKDNGRVLRFATSTYAETGRAMSALQSYAFPGRRNLGYLFAFESKRETVLASIETDPVTGQKIVTAPAHDKRFEAITEFGRLLGDKAPWAVWTQVNQTYQTCMTYPNVLVGPVTLDESSAEGQRIIRQCAAFRSENRLPALTWSSGTDGASLWRCSQPKIGLQGNRSPADELFLKHILESAASANALHTTNASSASSLTRAQLLYLTGSSDMASAMPPQDCVLKILDLRPRASAMANRTGGYGYENVSNYPGTTIQFCNIGNIHAVRDAYQKMSALCLSSNTADLQWTVALEDTKWLSHIRLILAASWEAAFLIHVHRLPVLLHCSHGWDRTSQVAVLAQLMLDPFYRTRKGFSVLVEKDFMSFGHPFRLRCAHGEGRGSDNGTTTVNTSSDDGQISPIFIQCLDCVFQLVNQYPECFEFNTKYLLLLSEHVYSCRFGNFLCDTEREREMVAGLRQRTNSVWDYLDEQPDTLNDTYSADHGGGVLLMPLPTLLRNVTLWVDRHCRHGPKATVRNLPVQDTGVCPDQQGSTRTVQEIQNFLARLNCVKPNMNGTI